MGGGGGVGGVHTHRLHCSFFFLWFIFRILTGIPRKGTTMEPMGIYYYYAQSHNKEGLFRAKFHNGNYGCIYGPSGVSAHRLTPHVQAANKHMQR